MRSNIKYKLIILIAFFVCLVIDETNHLNMAWKNETAVRLMKELLQ